MEAIRIINEYFRARRGIDYIQQGYHAGGGQVAARKLDEDELAHMFVMELEAEARERK